MATALQLSASERQQLREQLQRLRGDADQAPDGSIIIPVNAKNDLQVALAPLSELARYQGRNRFEVILVINNYPPNDPPAAIEEYRALGVKVVAVPDVRREGEVVIMSARAYGVQAAEAPVTIHFDSDVRFKNITALLDWYVAKLGSTSGVAYTHVGFYDVAGSVSVRVKILLHHVARWTKRNLMKIPTTRGSNYAVSRDLFRQLYDAHKLRVDMHVGPAALLAEAPVFYSGRRDLNTYTSARKYRPGWGRMLGYYLYRAKYNRNALKSLRDDQAADWEGYAIESETRVREQLEVQAAEGE